MGISPQFISNPLLIYNGNDSKSLILIKKGTQWGDEGKGKLVDILAGKYDYCCRFNGGANAGT